MSDDGGFEEPTAPAWMATFGDLMSLLLTFFVLLMSFASMDVRRYAAVAGSMRDAFGVQTVHSGPIEALATSVVDLSDHESTPYLRVIDTPSRMIPERDQAVLGRLQMTVESQKLERVVEIESTPRGAVLRVPGQMLFDSGSADLRPEALIFLHELAGVLREMPGSVAIEGHTDDQPSGAGDGLGNWDLSAGRAVAAVRYLIEVGKVDASRLQATGFGATRPRVANRSEAEREQNRRVEFVFLRTAPEVPAEGGTSLETVPAEGGTPREAAPGPSRRMEGAEDPTRPGFDPNAPKAPSASG